MTFHPVLLSLTAFVYIQSQVSGQLATYMDRALQTDNCMVWSSWGPCTWIKGPTPGHRWNQPYFRQLSKLCQNGVFYSKLENFFGVAVKNSIAYLKSITLDTQPCGKCSYQQSCGYKCQRRKGSKTYLNRLFVAERLCQPKDLNGATQDTACHTSYELLPKQNDECQIWPNPAIRMPNVTGNYRDIVNSIHMANCIKSVNKLGKPVCRCCCYPYRPDPRTWKCI